jgi:hypothetical protein
MIGTRLQHLDLKGWIYGLLHAAIGGGSSAVVGGFSAAIIKPADFSFAGANSFKLMGMMFVFNFVLSAFLYLKSSPLPEIVEESERRITAIEERNLMKDNEGDK